MHISLRNVGVVHHDGARILRDISFDIPPHTRVALIGESGAGKSTIGSLIRRDMDPTEGTIAINGIPLPRYNLSSVLAHMGVVLQQTEILSGTVRENILLSVAGEYVQSITDDDIWETVDTISPQMRERFGSRGLDTLVGKRGLKLSGGERQRVCIMRALIKNPEFLIIDEATSSLDSETEREVQAGIDAILSQGISALVIAHRFSTLRNCDRFIVLRTLRKCAEGEPQIETVAKSLEELYDRSSIFRKLAQSQEFSI